MENELRLIDIKEWDSFYADMGDSRNMADSYDRGYTDALDRVDDWMDLQPVVDATSVVRCKVCFFGYRDLVCTNPRCTKSFYGCPVPPEHYCSFGERIPDD